MNVQSESDTDSSASVSASASIHESEPAKNKLSMANSAVLTNLSRSVYMDQPLEDSVIFDKSTIVDQVLKPWKDRKTQKKLVRFQSIGGTLQIEPRVYKISDNQEFASLVRFLKKKIKSSDSVFCYLHNSFSPGLDEKVGALHENFAVGNELVVSYCSNPAFG